MKRGLFWVQTELCETRKANRQISRQYIYLFQWFSFVRLSLTSFIHQDPYCGSRYPRFLLEGRVKLDKLFIFVAVILISCIHYSLNDKHAGIFLLETQCFVLKKKKEFKTVSQSALHVICFTYDRECDSANGRLFKRYTQQILRLTWVVICDNVSRFNFVHKAFQCGVLKMNVVRRRFFRRS